MMDVKFNNLVKPSDHMDHARHALREIAESGIYLNGSASGSFARKFAEYCGLPYCVPVGNGFDALRISLMDSDIYRGCVAVPSNSPLPVWMAATNMMCDVYPVEPDQSTMTMSAEALRQALTSEKRISAVIVVHLYGMPCDMPAILDAIGDLPVALIEDCSQAHGAFLTIDGKERMVGTFGDYAAYSFYPTKNLGAMGDAGAILTKSEDGYNNMLAIHQYGMGKVLGINSRMDEIQAAILFTKLDYLNWFNKLRRRNAVLYEQNLVEIEQITLPVFHPGHVWHQYVIRLENSAVRDSLRTFLKKEGIETLIHYDPFPGDMEFYHPDRLDDWWPGCHLATQMSKTVLSLPIAQHLQEYEVQFVCDKIKSFFRRQ